MSSGLKYSIVTPGVSLCMRPVNERRRYTVTSSLIGWSHIQNNAQLHWLGVCTKWSLHLSLFRKYKVIFCIFCHISTQRECRHPITYMAMRVVHITNIFYYHLSYCLINKLIKSINKINQSITPFLWKGNDLIIPYNKDHACQWLGYSRRQGISSYDIDLILPEKSCCSPRRVNARLIHGVIFRNISVFRQ